MTGYVWSSLCAHASRGHHSKEAILTSLAFFVFPSWSWGEVESAFFRGRFSLFVSYGFGFLRSYVLVWEQCPFFVVSVFMQSCWLQKTNSSFRQQTGFDATTGFLFRSAMEERQNTKQQTQQTVWKRVLCPPGDLTGDCVMHTKMGRVICFCSDIVIMLLCMKVFFEARDAEAIVKKAAEPRTASFFCVMETSYD